MLLLLLASLPAAPLHEPATSDLLGAWDYGFHPQVTQTLVLKRDGTFDRYLQAWGKVTRMGGRWHRKNHYLYLEYEANDPPEPLTQEFIFRHATQDRLVVDHFSGHPRCQPILLRSGRRIILRRRHAPLPEPNR